MITCIEIEGCKGYSKSDVRNGKRG